MLIRNGGDLTDKDFSLLLNNKSASKQSMLTALLYREQAEDIGINLRICALLVLDTLLFSIFDLLRETR
jgi:hypothetical protein